MSQNLSVFYLVFVSLNFLQAFGQFENGKGKVGEACERDYHCINNAFCRAQLTCLCEPNYLPVPDFSLCVPTIGLICENEAGCALMSNAECRQNVCACKETFTVDITNSSNCLARPVAEHDSCQRNDECIDNLDRALCINNRCQCLTDHHFSVATGKCVRNAGILQSCTNDYQCYTTEMDDPENSLECRDGICKCKPGITGRHCSGASNNSATMMTAIIFLFFAIFLT